MTSTEYGATPVPLHRSATSFDVLAQPDGYDGLRPVGLRTAVPPVPDERRAVLELARQPMRRGVLVPVVGWEGGVGRTTVTRLLAAAFHEIRGEHALMVDAVPMWGGLTAAAKRPGEYAPADIVAIDEALLHSVVPGLLATVDEVPTLTGPSPIRGTLYDPAILLAAVGRLATLATMTCVDTVADVGGSPARELINDPASIVVWVASATRTGLWGIAEALTYYRAVGAQQVARRSVIAVVGGQRRWPAEAAAAAAQLGGLGVDTVRVPHSRTPLTDARCRAGAERLLAAIAARSS